MKKNIETSEEPEMRKEYDFSGAVRGKHYRAYRAGHRVCVHKVTGETEVHYFTQEDGAIMLDPDVKSHFRTAGAVNKALRAVLAHG